MSIKKISLNEEVKCLHMGNGTIYVGFSGTGEYRFNRFLNKFTEFIKEDDGLAEIFLMLLANQRSFLMELSDLQFDTLRRILGYIKEIEDAEALEDVT